MDAQEHIQVSRVERDRVAPGAVGRFVPDSMLEQGDFQHVSTAVDLLVVDGQVRVRRADECLLESRRADVRGFLNLLAQ